MAEKKYIRDFTVEQIVNEVPLYQKIYVSLEQTQSVAPYFQDLTKYNELLTNGSRILSECVSCMQPLAFESYTKKEQFPFEPFMKGTVPVPFPSNPYETGDNTKRRLVKTEIHPEITAHSPSYDANELSNEYFSINYKCTLDLSHTMSVAFKLTAEGTELSIMKIGQYPAISMLNQKAIRSYRKELEDHDYNELSKALQLHSNGFSVASFVYLRRIYENLIDKEHEMQCSSIGDWNEEEYQKQSFGERVKLLVDNGADIIPSEIDNHKANIYRILSLGVHQYSEEECTQYFDVLFSCITLILEHSITFKKKAANIHNIISALNNIP